MTTLQFVLRALVDGRICRLCACDLVAPWVVGTWEGLVGEASAIADSIHGFDMTVVDGRWSSHGRHPTDEAPWVFSDEEMGWSAGRWIEPDHPDRDPHIDWRVHRPGIPIGRTLTRPILELVMQSLLIGRIRRECACRLVSPWVEGAGGFDRIGRVGEIARAIHGFDVVVRDGVPTHGLDPGGPPYALTHREVAGVMSRWIWAGDED